MDAFALMPWGVHSGVWLRSHFKYNVNIHVWLWHKSHKSWVTRIIIATKSPPKKKMPTELRKLSRLNLAILITAINVHNIKENSSFFVFTPPYYDENAGNYSIVNKTLTLLTKEDKSLHKYLGIPMFGSEMLEGKIRDQMCVSECVCRCARMAEF